MKVVCIDNYYGEGFDEELFKYLKKADLPIFYKDNSYTYSPKDHTILITREGVNKTPFLQDEYRDLHTKDGEINVYLTKDLFDKYFIDIAKVRQEQIDSIINGE